MLRRIEREDGLLLSGVDGCRGGWVVVTAEASGAGRLQLRGAAVVSCFTEVIDSTSACDAVAVDIPIGLCDALPRLADQLARRRLGAPRASSVFPAPVRAALAARAYLEACEASFAASGKRLSRQAFAILPKIREADAAMTPALQQRVFESHPEVSFRALAGGGGTPAYNKHRPAGQAERRTLLESVYDALPARSAAGSAIDDLYDACVLAWTAARVVRGEALRLPAEPAYDSRGLRMEIVY
jgi:predicted RNase H-like nuclease